jgi:hypothetical protein
MKQFHASFRRENPTHADKNYTILDAEGDGQYVGTALFMQAIKPHDIGFLEGDEMIYIDGRHETTPSQWHHTMPVPQINGTGTEDYFSSGWYFDHGVYSAPYHGVVIKNEALAQISAYRWNIEDAIPFHKKILVTIEHGTNNDHVADYSSVAYFYQSGPHKPYPSLPSDSADLLPIASHVNGMIDGRELSNHATVTGGQISIQDMHPFPGNWPSDAQVFWMNGQPGKELTLKLHVPETGAYDVTLLPTSAPDYAVIQAMEKGHPIEDPIDLYAPKVGPHEPVSLGRMTLKKGPHELTFRIVGMNSLSSNYFVGIDAIKLVPAK